MTHHLGYEKHAPEGRNSGNSRNVKSSKTLKLKRGQVEIDVPRDRNSEFEPQLVKKGQTRFDGLDDKIISLYSRRMTTREIQWHLQEIYGVGFRHPDLYRHGRSRRGGARVAGPPLHLTLRCPRF